MEIQNRQREFLRRIVFASTALLSEVAGAAQLSIQGVVNGSQATVAASSDYGGAITSFDYRGIQYIDTADHGRELQSASAFDNHGECFNPTEAGNRDNYPSQLLSWSNDGEVLRTATNMAFWDPPGTPGSAACFSGVAQAVNTTVLSGHIFEKVVSFGLNGVPNVLNYSVTFNVPEKHDFGGVFEALTGYLVYPFSNSLHFNTTTAALSVAAGQTYPNSAFFQATSDGLNAMGVYGVPSQNGFLYYESQPLLDGIVNKWNCVFAVGAAIPAGSRFSYQCNVVFGTIDEVIGALRSLSGTSDGLVPVYRFRSLATGDHFLTKLFTEASSIGQWWEEFFYNSYTFEGTAFRVHPTAVADAMQALYRCYVPQTADHFVSVAGNCEGQSFEGMYGYVSAYPRDGYEPIYRFYKNWPPDHLTTTNYSEGINAGYVFEAVLGYAPTSN